jgi:hypothetical protein
MLVINSALGAGMSWTDIEGFMSMYVYVYVSLCVYLCMYVYICIYICIYTYMYTYEKCMLVINSAFGVGMSWTYIEGWD